MQPSTDGQITRAEYEARHNSLQAQITQIEARLFTEQAQIKADVERKFDRLLDGFENLRKELVAKELLKPQLEALERRLHDLEQEQVSRVERFWMRFGPLITLGMAILALVEFVTRFHLP